MAGLAMNLVMAVEAGDLFDVASRLNGGANPDCNYCGVYPIHMAIEQKNKDVVCLLLHKGASTAVKNIQRKTAVDAARASGDWELCALVEGGVEGEAFQAALPALKLRLDRAEVEHHLRRQAMMRCTALLILLAAALVVGLAAAAARAPDGTLRVFLPEKMIAHLRGLNTILEGLAGDALAAASRAWGWAEGAARRRSDMEL